MDGPIHTPAIVRGANCAVSAESCRHVFSGQQAQTRVAGEEYQVGVTFDPKPVPKQAGIGCRRLG